MKASELVARLSVNPEYEVVIFARDAHDLSKGHDIPILPTVSVETDCFHSNGPHVYVITADLNEQNTDALAAHLDGENNI